MSNVTGIGRTPYRAVVIQRVEHQTHSYVVVAMFADGSGRPADQLGAAQFAREMAEAWRHARAESARTGLPIIDLTTPPRRGPNQPGGGGGLAMAA